jgi:beta-phosphoglucomutase-like phosphatase (HAD superfamily)
MSDTTTSTLAAALWDFDGTLADTEPLWIAAEYDLIDKLGGTWWVTRCWTRAPTSSTPSAEWI